jgi:hypothetical protein
MATRSIWDRLFNRFTDAAPDPHVRFGRYTDSYKTSANYAAWEESLAAFEREAYLVAYEAFLRYLRDEEEDNVLWHRDGDTIYFEFYQGSKRVTGSGNTEEFRIEARVAHVNESRPQLLRRLVEYNYTLKYGRFALDGEQTITVVFDSYTTDASPFKLYYALKEVALMADKQDDLLLEEFQQLGAVESSHLKPLPAEEREVKRAFITGQIGQVLRLLDAGHPDPAREQGAAAYFLLDLIYKIDYLVKPEGYTMEAIERMHRLYFAKETDKTVAEKNERLMRGLRHLLERAPEAYEREMYRGRSTFGITTPVTHDRLVNLIDNELHFVDYYRDQGYEEVALAVPGYIVGYSLFNYALPQPDRDLLQLYYRITEDDYFRQLGFEQAFLNEKKKPQRLAIRRAVSQVADPHRAKYPKLYPQLSMLRYDSLLEFTASYLLMVRELDLSQI